ncbi:hypothetical protein DFQ28_005363 [Apophysomyces sp. BC1034]|nr:hypothetical protein DFQ28_005363 [Apophysomyces sp. BC1034]
MDVYTLARKKRPTHLTMGTSHLSSQSGDENAPDEGSSAVKNTELRNRLLRARSYDDVTGPPSRNHWKNQANAPSQAAGQYLACLNEDTIAENVVSCFVPLIAPIISG